MWVFFFFSSRRRHTRSLCDWSSDVCSSDLEKHRTAGVQDEITGIDSHGSECVFVGAGPACNDEIGCARLLKDEVGWQAMGLPPFGAIACGGYVAKDRFSQGNFPRG